MKKDIPYSAIAPREYPNEIDVVSVNLSLQDWHPLKVSSFYNPNGSIDIKTVLKEETIDKNAVIFGDFNAHSPIWENCVNFSIAGNNTEEFILTSNNFIVLTLHSLSAFYSIRNNTSSTIDLQTYIDWVWNPYFSGPSYLNRPCCNPIEIHAAKYYSFSPNSQIQSKDSKLDT